MNELGLGMLQLTRAALRCRSALAWQGPAQWTPLYFHGEYRNIRHFALIHLLRFEIWLHCLSQKKYSFSSSFICIYILNRSFFFLSCVCCSIWTEWIWIHAAGSSSPNIANIAPWDRLDFLNPRFRLLYLKIVYYSRNVFEKRNRVIMLCAFAVV